VGDGLKTAAKTPTAPTCAPTVPRSHSS
jgi:hypothetical protein